MKSISSAFEFYKEKQPVRKFFFHDARSGKTGNKMKNGKKKKKKRKRTNALKKKKKS